MHDIAQNPIQVFISPKNIPTIIKAKLIITNILPKVLYLDKKSFTSIPPYNIYDILYVLLIRSNEKTRAD